MKRPDQAIVVGEIFRVHDLAHPAWPLRTMRFTATAEPMVAVETICRRPEVVERIALLNRDADARLMRYCVAAPERV